MIVLNQDQVIGSTFWSLKGEVSRSSGSSYTGQTTRPNLDDDHRWISARWTRGSRKYYSLGVLERRALFVEQIVHAELDTAANYPAERAIVMIHCKLDHERVVCPEFRREERGRYLELEALL